MLSSSDNSIPVASNDFPLFSGLVSHAERASSIFFRKASSFWRSIACISFSKLSSIWAMVFLEPSSIALMRASSTFICKSSAERCCSNACLSRRRLYFSVCLRDFSAWFSSLVSLLPVSPPSFLYAFSVVSSRFLASSYCLEVNLFLSFSISVSFFLASSQSFFALS